MTDHIRDTTKKVLSPTGQAVLDAVLFEVNAECYAPWIAAAALRAAANQDPCGLNTGEYDEGWGEYDEGWGEAMATVIAIATELEGQ